MSYDTFRSVLMNAGEQITAADLNKMQRQLDMKIREMFVLPGIVNSIANSTDPAIRADPSRGQLILSGDAQPLEACFCPFPSQAMVVPGVSSRTVNITVGPLAQLMNRSQPLDDNSPFILFYWSEGSETLTTAVGHATNPRIDVVEMKLEMESGAAETRVVSAESVKASLNLGPLTPTVDTVIRARIGGLGGNSITLAFAADGTGTGSLTQNGNALIFHFETGVTTVGNFQTAVAASSLVEIQTNDASLGDTFTAGDVMSQTALAGGVDPILSASSINKASRVKATFQIKQGTAGATPAYPTVTAGYCAVAAIYVPATHNALHTDANIRDMRWPLGGIRAYDIPYSQMIPVTANLTLNHANMAYDFSGSAILRALCPVGNGMGRVLAIGVFGDASIPNAFDCDIERFEFGGSVVTLGALSQLENEISNLEQLSWATALDFMDAQSGGTRASNTIIGSPLWSDGTMNGPMTDRTYDGSVPIATEPKLVVTMASQSGTTVSFVRFIIAHGMG